MAQDEYDSYIGAIYQLLASGVSEDQLVAHLHRIETEEMGLSDSSVEALRLIARKLLALEIGSDAV